VVLSYHLDGANAIAGSASSAIRIDPVRSAGSCGIT
jgi:hypothetical protein